MATHEQFNIGLDVNSLDEIESALTSIHAHRGYDLAISTTALDKRRGAQRDASLLQALRWLVAIPYSAAVVCMILTSRHSDRTGERRWHIAIPALVGAAALVVSTFVPQTPLWAIVTLTVATMGILTGLAQFWVLPPAFLGGAAAAAGIALINSVRNLAGFVSPFIVGSIKDLTGSTNNGLCVIAASLLVGGAIIVAISQRGQHRSAS